MSDYNNCNDPLEIEPWTDVNPDPNHQTVCNGDLTDNIWHVGGVCKLDRLTYDQVYYVLTKIPRAKPDLIRVTDDPRLLALANSSCLVVPERQDAEETAELINKGRGGAGTLPFYTFLKGNTDGTIR